MLCMFINSMCQAQSDNAAKYAATISASDLRKHLTIVASEEMEGRETGTEGQRKAAAYIQSQFRTIGLQPCRSLKSYQQLFPLYKDSLAIAKVSINKKKYTQDKDYSCLAEYSPSKKIKKSDIIFVGYGISDKNYDEYAGRDVKGKTVVFFLGEPKINANYVITGSTKSSLWTYPGLAKKLTLAKSKGAIAALVINPVQPNVNSDASKLSTKRKTLDGYYFGSDAEKITSLVLSHDMAKNILGNTFFDEVLEKAKSSAALNTTMKEVSANLSISFKKYEQKIDASNVMGIIEGTDKKDEYVFLTAHYDHLGKRNGKIYYGADDDGSGTCAVMEIAEAFQKAKNEGKGPRRTVVCMTVSGEEKGLWGSQYYSDHPVFPLDKTSVDLNIDMIGRIDTERKSDDTLNYIYVIGHDKISSDLATINEDANNKHTQLQLDYKFDDPNDPHKIYYRSDHYNFARKGVPVLFFYDGMLQADYHQPTDTVDKIYWDLYEKRTRMIFHTAWEMANRDEMLRRDWPLGE